MNNWLRGNKTENKFFWGRLTTTRDWQDSVSVLMMFSIFINDLEKKKKRNKWPTVAMIINCEKRLFRIIDVLHDSKQLDNKMAGDIQWAQILMKSMGKKAILVIDCTIWSEKVFGVYICLCYKEISLVLGNRYKAKVNIYILTSLEQKMSLCL